MLPIGAVATGETLDERSRELRVWVERVDTLLAAVVLNPDYMFRVNTSFVR